LPSFMLFLSSNLTIKVWRLRVGETTTNNYIRCGLNQLQKTLLEQFAHHCLVSQPHTNANTRSILPHHNTKTQRKQRPAIISNTVPRIHHYNDQTPSHHTGTVPLPPARRLSRPNQFHRLKPVEQPERHGAFF